MKDQPDPLLRGRRDGYQPSAAEPGAGPDAANTTMETLSRAAKAAGLKFELVRPPLEMSLDPAAFTQSGDCA